jgi:CheY-like chemotaxis protein
VEDNSANIRLIDRILDNTQHKMISASNGLEGLEMAHKHRPDLILLDINLPDINGFSVLDELKAADLDVTPVVAISANAMDRDVKKGLAAGFDAYLKKPLDIHEFINTINSLVH